MYMYVYVYVYVYVCVSSFIHLFMIHLFIYLLIYLFFYLFMFAIIIVRKLHLYNPSLNVCVLSNLAWPLNYAAVKMVPQIHLIAGLWQAAT